MHLNNFQFIETDNHEVCIGYIPFSYWQQKQSDISLFICIELFVFRSTTKYIAHVEKCWSNMSVIFHYLIITIVQNNTDNFSFYPNFRIIRGI